MPSKSKRFLPLGKDAAAETQARHEVMDLVRENPELSLLVVQLHDAGRSWRDVKAAVEIKTKLAKRPRSADVQRQ
jgi:hypothetical protein